MNKLEELKNFVADLFSAATDKTTIEKSAIVNQKFEEAQKEQTKLQDDYAHLLNDYKDVVLHSSFKPDNVNSGIPNDTSAFNSDEFITNFLNTHKADGSAK